MDHRSNVYKVKRAYVNASPKNKTAATAQPTPKYQQLIATLTHEIQSRKYPPGSLFLSEHELSRHYNLSRHTVRAALAQLEDQGYLARMRGKGTFVQYPPVRPNDPRGEIGVLVPCVTIALYPEVVRGVEEIATDAGRHLILGCYDVQPEKERQHVARMLEKPVSGMILCPSYTSTASIYQPLLYQKMPMVLVDTAVDGIDADLVATNGFEGARQGVIQLAGTGCRTLAFLSGYRSASTSRERLAGFRSGLEDVGLPCNDALILEGAFSDAFGQTAIQKLLAMPQKPDGILIANDPIATGVIQGLHEAGISIPGAMRLCVFDEPELPLQLRVPLIIIRQPRRLIGATAARLLLERIEARAGTEAPIPPRIIRLSPEITPLA